MTSHKRPVEETSPNEDEQSSLSAKLPRFEEQTPANTSTNAIIVSGIRKGERPEMQDRHSIHEQFNCGVNNLERCALLCLFDGHAGFRASEYSCHNFHRNFSQLCQKYSGKQVDLLEKNLKRAFIEAYKKTDDDFLSEARKIKPPLKDGTTATTIFLLNNTIYSANIGDSQAVLCRRKDDGELLALQLTADHSPINFEERSRIQKAGGVVNNGRLLGILEVSRAFGDGHLKAYGLISTPTVKKITLTDADLFVICGTDGLWKVFKPAEAIKYVHEKYLKTQDKNLFQIFESIAGSLAAEAVLRGSGDNVSVILTVFESNIRNSAQFTI